jgi:multiple sugar transport system permease protein/raffinose/stachyose/melibiose transport system permease protein
MQARPAVAVGAAQAPRQRKTLWRRLKANSGFLFILPATLIFTIFGLYTVIYSIVLSFFRWNGFGKFSLLPFACQYPACAFVGLGNFREFLYQEPTRSRYFWWALEHNITIGVIVTAGTILIALPLAIALNRAARGQSVYRLLIMLPMVTAGIAVYYVWTFIYEPDGLLNTVLNSLGLGFLQARQGWLGQSNTALPALMAVLVWSAVPMATILYLAGLQTIDRELYEAATMDGANPWQLLWRITWPLLYPVTVIIIITSINAAFQGYEMVYLMTYGGPAGHTEVVGLQIFKYGFGDQRQLGMASAMSWVLFLAVFVVSLFNLRILRSRT